MTKRRVQIEKHLFFEYEVKPHRSILDRIATVSGEVADRKPLRQEVLNTAPKVPSSSMPALTGTHIPLKQIRSVGHTNPLKPPLDLETVLIGRALGQRWATYMGLALEFAMTDTSTVSFWVASRSLTCSTNSFDL